MRRIVILVAAALLSAGAAGAAEPQVARGRYLATLGGCMDCHTPGSFLGKRDDSRTLAGSEVGFEIPQFGVFYGPNLTPDKETGLGGWTRQQIATAIQTGMRPDGRQLAPIMPYRDFAALTPSDALAIAAYLQSLPPVRNKVPGPFGPTEPATGLVMKIVPPAK